MNAPDSQPPPSEASRRHSHRKTQARLQLVGVLLLLLAGFGMFFAFAFSADCRWPVLKGAAFGGSVTALLLLGATWARQVWARVVLVLVLLGVVVMFSLCLLGLMTNPTDANSPGVRTLSIGLACIIAAGGWLVLSKRIRYLTAPAGSGGRA
jgi:peptidoglycan/LPS O-acetylase OafA/YrhL